MMNSRILCITRDDPELDHDSQVDSLLKGGARLIQLRSKKLSCKSLLDQAHRAAGLTKSKGAKLIINDSILLASEINADGVHLGITDGTVAQARKLLPTGKIIGRTVHSIKEAKLVKKELPDYVGLGPYRKSITKNDLSPSLSDDDFMTISKLLHPIPVFLIGGLTIEDFSLIHKIGVHGLALCSSLFAGKDLAYQASEAVAKSKFFSPATQAANIS